ncbi:MAG: ATP-binding cassette domain-containing protein, partial [Demequinaceae bacterium]|nr:ATP-binding cassette domain-containing protein [Demequinaceae bacterium]
MTGTQPLLEVNNLVVDYPVKGLGRKAFRVLKGVSLDVMPGECVGLVGESGSGKTTLGRAVLGLAPVTEGSVRFKGQEIGHLPRRQRRMLSDQIQVVFQDPY